jgi:hypothetical protein
MVSPLANLFSTVMQIFQGDVMLRTSKKRMNLKIQAILVFFALFSLPSAAAGAPWDLLGQDDAYAVYFDEGSLTLISDTASKVWIKVVPKGREYREDILKSLKQRGLAVEGYENFAYRMESVELECALQRHRVLETADYDGEDRKLNASFPVSEWRETRPGTPYASLAKVICRQHGEEGDWWNKYPEHQSHEEQ